MNPQPHIHSLERFATILPTVATGLSLEESRWKPSGKDWSILEILCHLADEETEDFRPRIALTLRNPSLDWPPIDPPRWAIDRRYNDADLTKTLDRFLAERHKSITWLNELQNPDWSRARVHPKFGPMHAGMLLASWAAHDLLHLRQITKRLYQLTARDAGEYSTLYAGEWTA